MASKLQNISALSNEIGKSLANLEVQRTAAEQIQTIVRKLAQNEGVNEEMKATDPMMWTGLMNNLLHSAEEIVLPEVVYS